MKVLIEGPILLDINRVYKVIAEALKTYDMVSVMQRRDTSHNPIYYVFGHIETEKEVE